MGRFGEKIARSFLRAQRVEVLAKNFKAPGGGEVDIVAKSGKVLLFIEVKTRKFDTKIRPFDAVNAQKQALIQRGGEYWLKLLKHRNLPWRYDVIEIWLKDGKKPKINWIKDAF